MDELEDRLRRAFEREEPPAGFAERVFAQTRGARTLPRWLAAAAVLVLAVAGYAYRWHEGQTAKREVLLALRITSAKLSHIQAQVAR